MKNTLLVVSFILMFKTTLFAGELPKELVDNLTRIIKSHRPEAIIEVKKGSFLAKAGTMQFTVHGMSKNGVYGEQTYREEGPNFGGFFLRISAEEGGPYQGQAIIPQTITQVYWETYIDRPPLKDGSGYYDVHFSYGKGKNSDLRQALLRALPRTDMSAHCRAGWTALPEPSLTITDALTAAREYLDENKIDDSRHYIDDVRLLQQSSLMSGKHWVITWKNKNQFMDGGEIILVIGMNKEIKVLHGE